MIPGDEVYLIQPARVPSPTDPARFFAPKAIVTRVEGGVVDVKFNGLHLHGLPLRQASDPVPAGDYCEPVT